MPDTTRNTANDDALSDEMKDLTGKSGGGESGGGAYPNPHTGKEQREGKKQRFDGGQSDNRYFGPRDAAGNSAKGAGRDRIAGDEKAD